jgi:ABC-2 type transport system ATP-binding protein
MSIAVANLTKIYGSQKAVNDISFTVNQGEVVGFLGPNGAGKSTTMKIITGYITASDGNVTVCDENVNTDALAVKKRIGYLPESNALYYDMYVREYLQFLAGIHHIKNAKSVIESVIEKVGLTPEAGKKIGQLSKGYKQRVGLAAALIHDPEVLILDEPTSGLDPNQIVEIREVIKELGKQKTILFSSHILQEVQAICDRVIIIDKGKIVADDTLHHLQNNSAAQQVVVVQFKEKIEEYQFKILEHINKIEKLGEERWKLKTHEPEKVRKQLMEMSLKNNLNIVSLQSENISLETIFRQLTSSNFN